MSRHLPPRPGTRPRRLRWRGALRPLVAAAFLVVAPQTLAEQYSVPIVVESEEDIFDLYENGDILEHEMDVLLELFQRKVDLNRASRDELFELPGMTYPMADAILEARRELGEIEELEQLYSREAIPYDVLQQIEPFVVFGRARLRLDDPVSGSVRLKAVEASGDGQLPSTNARIRLSALDGRLDAGWVGALRESPGPAYLVTPESGAEPYFIADASRPRVRPFEKGYLSFRTPVGDSAQAQVIVGTFNAGFGERLTLDTTNRRRPYGIYVDDLIYDSVVGIPNYSASFRTHRGLQGISSTIQGIRLGGGLSLDLTVLGSYNVQSEYQYRYTPNRTYFSEADVEPGPDRCTVEERCHSFATFPGVFRNQLAGGNARLWTSGRSYVGFTGYAANNQFMAGDEVVEWTPSARYPIRRTFGALGFEAGYGVGLVDFFGEYSRTDNGGNALILRSLWDLDRVALEITGRYYDALFDNPFGRGEASPSQFLGRRARDEVGGKVRATIHPSRGWRIVTHADTWVHPLQERHDMDLYLRNEWEPTRQVRWSVWTRLVDKDLTVGGRDQDYERSPNLNYDEVYLEDDPDGAAVALRGAARDLARGMRAEVGNQLTVKPSKTVTVAAYGRLTWRDVSVYDDSFERGMSLWLRGAVKPARWLDLSGRVRYWNEDLAAQPEDTDGDGVLDYQRGHRFVELYGRVGVSLPKKFRAFVRYDIRKFTDVRERERDPQHLVRGQVEYLF